ncbi:MAG: hypothetical protein K9N07_03610 [Candidatus Cloacimonetes bacterium]|nr:hypothetical protein [Candidatus Cloacimonadota bacterium]
MKIKTVLILFILLVFLIILFQNLEVVPIQLLFWKIQIARVILLPLTLILGMLIGYLITKSKKKKDID